MNLWKVLSRLLGDGFVLALFAVHFLPLLFRRTLREVMDIFNKLLVNSGTVVQSCMQFCLIAEIFKLEFKKSHKFLA